MKQSNPPITLLLIDENGVVGTAQVDQDAQLEALNAIRVVLEDGRELYVAGNLLLKQDDGRYSVPIVFEAFAMASRSGEEVVRIPIIEEVLRVGKRTVEADNVRVVKRVENEEREVAVPITQQSLSVERVPINKVVNSAEKMRQEGNVLVIPIYEERLVVQKQLVMVEAVRVTLHSEQTEHTETHNLRKESVEIKRSNA